ncbi:hypothetical protein ECG_07351 [Echinococcus granulosus]|uniref:Secreted protein n=1 Tax=Echinococcus granulosus TaxID=6210 RepID=A0A068WQF9_ECHGR|nr:hypothetical protein ECG_07351 [Echinococcus granulosus]CDS22042.1 hypothetical protein EgrG_000063900 [Echinococcus granulosus]
MLGKCLLSGINSSLCLRIYALHSTPWTTVVVTNLLICNPFLLSQICHLPLSSVTPPLFVCVSTAHLRVCASVLACLCAARFIPHPLIFLETRIPQRDNV